MTAGGVYELLRDARKVLPVTAEYALAETSVGWRPGTPDNAPHPRRLRPRRAHAGHRSLPQRGAAHPGHRCVVAALIMHGELAEVAAPFTLDRFA